MKTKIIVSIPIAIIFATASTFTLRAQDAAAPAEKSSVSIDLSFHQKNAEVPVLKVFAKSKIKKKFKPVANVIVNLYIGEENAKGFIGRITTTREGVGALPLSGNSKTAWEGASSSKFIATLTGDKRYEDASSEIEITKAKIEIAVNEKDSVRTITAKLLARKDSAWVEVPETELKFVVKRYFKDLPLSDEAATTDATGSATAEYKLKVPGDDDGDIFVGAKIEENDTYGNVQATVAVKWGTAIVKDDTYNEFNERTLWATRDKTPYWLLIFPNLIIATVWGFIIYLIILIARIRKVGLSKLK